MIFKHQAAVLIWQPFLFLFIMFKYLLISIPIFCLFSCETNFNKNYFSELLKNTTHLKIYCFQNKDTSRVLIDNPNSLSIFKEIINGKDEELSPEKASGVIAFYDHDKRLITATLTPSACYYNYGNIAYKARLTYKTGRHFEEICYQISE